MIVAELKCPTCNRTLIRRFLTRRGARRGSRGYTDRGYELTLRRQ